MAMVGQSAPFSHVAASAVDQASPPSKPQASLARLEAAVAQAAHHDVLADAQQHEIHDAVTVDVERIGAGHRVELEAARFRHEGECAACLASVHDRTSREPRRRRGRDRRSRRRCSRRRQRRRRPCTPSRPRRRCRCRRLAVSSAKRGMAISLPEAAGDAAIAASERQNATGGFPCHRSGSSSAGRCWHAPMQRPCSSPRSIAARKWMPP